MQRGAGPLPSLFNRHHALVCERCSVIDTNHAILSPWDCTICQSTSWSCFLDFFEAVERTLCDLDIPHAVIEEK